MDLYLKFLMVISVIGILELLVLISNIDSLFVRLKKLNEKKIEKLDNDIRIDNEIHEKNMNNFSSNIDDVISILDLCRTLITVEVHGLLEQYTRLNQKYEYIKIDDDSKIIAEKVFNAINSECLIYNGKHGILNTDYILSYIASETILILMNEAQTLNVSLLMK